MFTDKDTSDTQIWLGRPLMTHIVLLQLKPTTTDKDIDSLFQSMHAMQHHIPHLVAVTTGENHSLQHKGWTHGILFHFLEDQHLQQAMKLSLYQNIIEQLTSLCDTWITFDIPQLLPLNQVISPPPTPSAQPQISPRTSKQSKRQRGITRAYRQIDPRIVALTIEQLGVDETEVVFTASLVEDLNADSLDLVEYMLALEETFRIQIPDEDISVLMRSIGDIQNYLVAKGVLQDARN